CSAKGFHACAGWRGRSNLPSHPSQTTASLGGWLFDFSLPVHLRIAVKYPACRRLWFPKSSTVAVLRTNQENSSAAMRLLSDLLRRRRTGRQARARSGRGRRTQRAHVVDGFEQTIRFTLKTKTAA